MANDDDVNSWMYDEEMWEEGEEESPAPPREVQCRRCLHWIAPDSLLCPWCGKPIERTR